MADDAEFSGRVALVTGAGAGIGRAICHRLARGGAVVPTDKHEGRLAAVAGELDELWPGSLGMDAVLDIEHREQFDDVFGQVERRLGPIRIYVWNAALNQPQPLFDHDPESFDRILYANLNNCWYSCMRIVEQMQAAGGGSIVMIGSIAPDVVATVREPPYALSKAAIRALVLAIAKAGGPFNIRCNEVITGLVTGTRFTDSRPERAAEVTKDVPLGRLATVDDISAAVAYLCSEAGSFVSGEVLNVSGGLYVGSSRSSVGSFQLGDPLIGIHR